jgi:hypothetical protein
VLQRVHNFDQMLRDVEFQQVYTLSFNDCTHLLN